MNKIALLCIIHMKKIIATLALAIILLPNIALGAVTIEGTSTVSSSNNFSHTVPANTDFLSVCVQHANNTNPTLTFDGDSLTEAIASNDSNKRTSIFYLENPTAKTAIISASSFNNASSGTSFPRIIAINIAGADTVGVTQSKAWLSGNNPDFSITPSGSDGILFGCGYFDNAGASHLGTSITGGGTSLHEISFQSGDQGGAGAYEIYATSTSPFGFGFSASNLGTDGTKASVEFYEYVEPEPDPPAFIWYATSTPEQTNVQLEIIILGIGIIIVLMVTSLTVTLFRK
jgi:hypothetical protein